MGASKIDTLLKSNDLVTLKKLIDQAVLLYSDAKLPSNPKEHDLIIIDNEYEVKSLFEFYDGQWNDKVDKRIAKLLENDKGTTYGNLFNYKINAKEFDPYTSDNFKHSDTSISKVVVKIIDANNSETAINQALSKLMHKEMIDAKDVINLQVTNLDSNPCKIILSYKN